MGEDETPDTEYDAVQTLNFVVSKGLLFLGVKNPCTYMLRSMQDLNHCSGSWKSKNETKSPLGNVPELDHHSAGKGGAVVLATGPSTGPTGGGGAYDVGDPGQDHNPVLVQPFKSQFKTM